MINEKMNDFDLSGNDDDDMTRLEAISLSATIGIWHEHEQNARREQPPPPAAEE